MLERRATSIAVLMLVAAAVASSTLFSETERAAAQTSATAHGHAPESGSGSGGGDALGRSRADARDVAPGAARGAPQEFGPYRYRVGVERDHFRWSFGVIVTGDAVELIQCGQLISGGAPATEERCLSVTPEAETEAGGDVLAWTDIHERFRLNRRTGRLTVLDISGEIASVLPGPRPWPETPLVH